jgi:hypothetical protein
MSPFSRKKAYGSEKIAYHLGRDRQVFHLTLNSDDLDSLLDIIIRAQTKGKTLQVLMKNANIENLGH